MGFLKGNTITEKRADLVKLRYKKLEMQEHEVIEEIIGVLSYMGSLAQKLQELQNESMNITLQSSNIRTGEGIEQYQELKIKYDEELKKILNDELGNAINLLNDLRMLRGMVRKQSKLDKK